MSGGILFSESNLLANGESFTSDIYEIDDQASVTIAVRSDVAGSYQIRFCNDTTENWDSTLPRTYRPGKIHPPERFTVGRGFFQVVYTNTSGSDQTLFRLQVLVGDKGLLNFPLDGILPQRADAIAIRSDSYKIDVGAQRREGTYNWRKFGFKTNVNTGSAQTIWPGAQSRLVPLTTASTLTIVSTSTEDSFASGTGLRQIKLIGIGPGRVYQEEIINLNGTSPELSTKTWLGINRVVQMLCGTNKTNVGTISITDGVNDQAVIPTGEGITQQCFYFVPIDRTMHFDGLWWNCLRNSGGGDPVVTIRAVLHDLDNGISSRQFRVDIDTSIENTGMLLPPNPFSVPGGHLLEFTAQTTLNNTVVNLNVWGTELENP